MTLIYTNLFKFKRQLPSKLQPKNCIIVKEVSVAINTRLWIIIIICIPYILFHGEIVRKE